MEKLPMCRVCLAEDVRMHPLLNTHLQGIYESLSMTPLETNDSRPLQACYICCARLQNCFLLRESSLRSEELFKQMFNSDKLRAVNRQDAPTSRLSVTAVVHLSMGDVPHESSDVKFEPPEVFVDVVVKQEGADEKEDRPARETGLAVTNVHSMESEDDVPLDIVKNELQDDTNTQKEEPPAATSSRQNNGAQVEVKVEQKWNKKEHIVKLVEHIIADDKPFYYQCRACKKSFYQRTHLNSHICANTDKKPYKCDVCDKRFKLKCRLIFHVRKHSEEEPYRCEVCNKSFDKKYLLNYHVRAHTGEKPYRCEVCDKRFITKSYLLKHVRMHSSERPFECDVCKKTFKEKSNLIVHVRQHSGEKPYQCEVCKKRFNYNGNLKKHIQIHTGERPHECEVCGKRFINNSDLVKHRRTHTHSGEKPYRCELCHETFNYNSNFLKHKRDRCRLSQPEPSSQTSGDTKEN